METKILECKNLSKNIGKKQILKNVELEISEGDILGFIGPNGAGKTTTIKLILGLQKITSGYVKINGYDIKENFEKAIEKVGTIVENPDLYMYMSGYKNLKLIANLYKDVDQKRVEEVIKITGLENRINDKVSKYVEDNDKSDAFLFIIFINSSTVPPAYSAKATAASLPERNIRPYNKCSTVISSFLAKPNLEPPVDAELLDIFTLSDKLQFSITTIAVIIFVVDAILHFSYSCLPYRTVLEFLSITTECLAFISGISSIFDDVSIVFKSISISSSRLSSA